MNISKKKNIYLTKKMAIILDGNIISLSDTFTQFYNENKTNKWIQKPNTTMKIILSKHNYNLLLIKISINYIEYSKCFYGVFCHV